MNATANWSYPESPEAAAQELAAFWASSPSMFHRTTAAVRSCWESRTVEQLRARRGGAWLANETEAHWLAVRYLALAIVEG
jgi:hypothetical protein